MQEPTVTATADTTQPLTPAEFESVRRVTAMLDAEADAAPTPGLRALWRRLAANTRREFS